MSPEEYRPKLERALEGVRMAPWRRREVLHKLEGVVAEVQAAGLTADDRRGLAAVFGYELGVDEGAVEIRNMRTMLEAAGVSPADANGEPLSTIRMVETLLPRNPGGDGSLTPDRAAEIRRAGPGHRR